jgi:hypothetical protein
MGLFLSSIGSLQLDLAADTQGTGEARPCIDLISRKPRMARIFLCIENIRVKIALILDTGR